MHASSNSVYVFSLVENTREMGFIFSPNLKIKTHFLLRCLIRSQGHLEFSTVFPCIGGK